MTEALGLARVHFFVDLVGEESLEDFARIDELGSGGGFVTPRDVVRIAAAVATVTLAVGAPRFRADLDGSEAGLLSKVICGDLIGGSSGTNLCACR